MANIFDINLDNKRKGILYSYLSYIVLFFLYTLAVIFIFHFTKEQTGMDDGYGYYLISYFLLPHHLSLFFALLFYIPAWAYDKKWLALLSMPLDLSAALYLLYASFSLWRAPESLPVFMLLLITFPLSAFSFWLFNIIYRKITSYFFLKKNKAEK